LFGAKNVTLRQKKDPEKKPVHQEDTTLQFSFKLKSERNFDKKQGLYATTRKRKKMSEQGCDKEMRHAYRLAI
jgi:hypothetical protein